MDTDLYQILSLALLGLIVLTLLGVLSALGRIRKALQEQGRGASEGSIEPGAAEGSIEPGAAEMSVEPEAAEAEVAGAGIDAAPEAAEPSDAAEEPEPAEPQLGADEGAAATPSWASAASQEPSPVVTPEPQPAAETPSSQPDIGVPSTVSSETSSQRPAEETPSGMDWDRAEDDLASGSERSAEAIPDEEEPSLAESPFATSTTAAEPSAAEIASARDDEGPEEVAAEEGSEPAAQPQDQPFERDGRWFFRRGDELLVYEESTGQWLPADHVTSTVMGVGAPTETASAPETETDEGTAESEEQTDALEATAPQPASSGGFWKCPQCGAVNGSTAATCRMCFTARP